VLSCLACSLFYIFCSHCLAADNVLFMICPGSHQEKKGDIPTLVTPELVSTVLQMTVHLDVLGT
jgi:hypothetical protein